MKTKKPIADKFDNAKFELNVLPQDSGFLETWKELRTDQELRTKIEEIRNEIKQTGSTGDELKEAVNDFVRG